MNKPGEVPGKTMGQTRKGCDLHTSCRAPPHNWSVHGPLPLQSSKGTASLLCTVPHARPSHLLHVHGSRAEFFPRLPGRTEPCSVFSTQDALSPLGWAMGHSNLTPSDAQGPSPSVRVEQTSSFLLAFGDRRTRGSTYQLNETIYMENKVAFGKGQFIFLSCENVLLSLLRKLCKWCRDFLGKCSDLRKRKHRNSDKCWSLPED